MSSSVKTSFEYVEEFNSVLKKLMRLAIGQSRKLQIYDYFIDTNRRFNLALNESPLLAVEIVGPRLLKYADQIKKRNVEFFLKSDFTEEIDDDQEQGDRDQIAKTITIVKDMYTKCTSDDKEKIGDMIDDLLINYCGYCRSTEIEVEDCD